MAFDQNNDPNSYGGLLACFNTFQGAYCVRKLTEFIVSIVLLVITAAVIIAYAYKYRLERKLWMLSILSFMAISLFVNVMFCLYNQQYWLYALEIYSYNLYYLFIVGYICKAYLLKTRHLDRGDRANSQLHILKESAYTLKNQWKTAFFVVFIGLIVLYTAIFVLSIIKEIQSQQDNDSNSQKIQYCEEVEYLCFDVLCTVMSIFVLVVLYKNQKEENEKMERYSEVARRNKPRGSLLSQDSGDDEIMKSKIHNPLMKLWTWILINVTCQIFGLIQSGLLLDATPSQCLMIKSNPNASNYLDLAFTFLSMYLGYVGTLWYITLIKLIRETSIIDRTIIFSQEVKVEGNIELFLPSKEETVIIL